MRVRVCVCSLIVWELGCSRPPERQRGGKWRREISTSGKSTTARNPEPLIAADQEYAVFCVCHCILLLYLYFPSSLRASWPQEVRPSLWESASCDNLSQPLTTQYNTAQHNLWQHMFPYIRPRTLPENAKSVGKYKDIKLKIRCQGQALPRYT